MTFLSLILKYWRFSFTIVSVLLYFKMYYWVHRFSAFFFYVFVCRISCRNYFVFHIHIPIPSLVIINLLCLSLTKSVSFMCFASHRLETVRRCLWGRCIVSGVSPKLHPFLYRISKSHSLTTRKHFIKTAFLVVVSVCRVSDTGSTTVVCTETINTLWLSSKP